MITLGMASFLICVTHYAEVRFGARTSKTMDRHSKWNSTKPCKQITP